MLISVVLPAPFSPSNAWTSPQRAEKSTAWLAMTPGKPLSMPVIDTARSLMVAAVCHRSGLGQVPHDVGKYPVHLIGLHVGVVFALAAFRRRPFVVVAERLARRGFDVALV